jgi:hypothetical protein
MLKISDKDAVILLRLKRITFGCWLAAAGIGILSGAAMLSGFETTGTILLALVWLPAIAFVVCGALSVVCALVLLFNRGSGA